MQRLVVFLALAAMVVGVVFFLRYQPDMAEVAPEAPASTPVPRRVTDADVPLPVAPRPVDAAPESVAAEVDAGVAKGPFVIQMGDYTLAMRDSKLRLRAALKITTDNETTAREIRRRRSQLRRMLYFLSAHRTEDGMRGTVGRDRFRDDLLERFKNVIKTGDVDALEFTTWEMVEAAPSSAAPASE